LNNRYKSVEEFINKLSKISVPDWKPVGNGFEALAWKKKDWRIRQIIKKKKGIEFIVEKSTVGLQNFRRCLKTADLGKALAFVEEH